MDSIVTTIDSFRGALGILSAFLHFKLPVKDHALRCGENHPIKNIPSCLPYKRGYAQLIDQQQACLQKGNIHLSYISKYGMHRYMSLSPSGM